MTRQEIDPQLPYIQVHRGVGMKAMRLATALGCTYQHARGALASFWEAFADRRVLADALARWGPERPMVVVPEVDLRVHLRMAFGQDVDPRLMEVAGFLEPHPDGYRIRGMTPYFETEARREEESTSNRARGAKRAATATRTASGRFQPAQLPNAPEEATPSSQAPAAVQPATSREPAAHQPDTSREVRGERREVRDEKTAAAADGVSAMGGLTLSPAAQRELASRRNPTGPVVLVPPDTPEETWSGEEFERWFQCRRQAAGLPAERKRPEPRALSGWWNACLMTPGVTVKALKRAVSYGYGKDKYWEAQGFPFGGFMDQWDKFLSQVAARATAS